MLEKKTKMDQEEAEAEKANGQASGEKELPKEESPEGADDFVDFLERQSIGNRLSLREEGSELESPELKADMYKNPKLRDVYL